MLFWAKHLDSALQDEETLITRCAISENCAPCFVLFQDHSLIALVNSNLVSLVLEVFQKLVFEEEHVQSIILKRLLFVLMTFIVCNDFVRIYMMSVLCLLLDTFFKSRQCLMAR